MPISLANQTTSTGSPYYNSWTSTTITSISSTSLTLPSNYLTLPTQTFIGHIPQLFRMGPMGEVAPPDPPLPRTLQIPDTPLQRESVPAVVRARENAEELLLRHLSEEQRNSFIAAGFFIVVGQRTRKRYRIERHSYSGNIHEMNANDQVTHRLCCHLAGNIPLADHLLAQKLSLEADEEAFLRLANRNEIIRG